MLTFVFNHIRFFLHSAAIQFCYRYSRICKLLSRIIFTFFLLWFPLFTFFLVNKFTSDFSKNTLKTTFKMFALFFSNFAFNAGEETNRKYLILLFFIRCLHETRWEFEFISTHFCCFFNTINRITNYSIWNHAYRR